MATPEKVLAIVQAGGAGGRMDVLTRERAKPALPFAGVYQLLDFPLSNLANSGIVDVWLSVQYQAASLDEQAANGRPWDLDRTHGGFRLLMPQEGAGSLDEDGFAQGNADELFRVRDELAGHGADVVVVASADHVYRLDFRDVLAAHREAGAECTVVVTDVPAGDDPSDHAVVQADAAGRVTGFAYKPDEPEGEVVATEVFVYDARALLEVLDGLHRELGSDSPGGDTGLGDFGEHLVPRFVERGRTVAHRLDGYWRDLGQPHLYLAAHRDVLRDDVGVLGVPGWPIRTRQPQRAAARVLEGATVVDSLVSPGCRVAGKVVRSVLGPGVHVGPGARVRDSVVFADTVVGDGARVDQAVLDADCRLDAGCTVGSPDVDAARDPAVLTLVGRSSVVGAGVEVPAGARLEPGSTA